MIAFTFMFTDPEVTIELEVHFKHKMTQGQRNISKAKQQRRGSLNFRLLILEVKEI